MANYSLGEARGKIVLETDFSSLKEGQKALEGYKSAANGTAQSQQEAWRKTGTAATVGGAAIVAGFGVAVAAASSFEFGMSAIQAVSGATADEMDLIREAALRIGADTAFSASEAASAMEELSKAGISTKDILGGAADAVVALAAAGGVDLPTAATIASNAMNQFGISADGLVSVTDKIAGAANASAIDMGQFAMAMSQVGAVANLAGMSFDDTTLAIAAMGNAGIVGSDAGTSLKSMLMNLQPTTEAAATAMSELGLITEDGANQFYDAEGKLKSLNEISGILATGLDGLSDAQKTMALETIFGSDAIRAAAVIADTGSAGFDKLTSAIDSTSAADVAATRLDNMKGSTEALMGSVETLAINVGSKLIPMLTDVVNNITDAVNWFGNLDDGMQDAILATAGVVGGLLLVVGTAIKVSQAMAGVRGTILALTGAQGILTAAQGTSVVTLIATKAAWIGVQAASLLSAAATYIMVGAVYAQIAASNIAAAAQWAFNAALNANPISLIILAIVALVAGLIWFFTQTELGQQIWAGFVAGLAAAWQWLQEAATNTWNAIMTAIAAVVDWFGSNVMPVIQAVIDFVIAYFTLWYDIVSTVMTAIMTVIGAVVDWFMAHVAPVIGAFIDLLVAIFMFFWNTLVDIWNNIMSFISDVVSNIVDFVVDAFNFWLNAVQVTLRGIWKVISDIWNNIVSFLEPIVAYIVAFVTTYFNILFGIISDIFNAVWSVISDIWNNIVSFISTVVNAVVSVIKNTWNSIASFVGDVFKNVYNAVKGPIDDALNLVSGFKDKILGFFSGAGKWLLDAGKNIIKGLMKGIEDALGGLTDLLGNITNLIPEKKGPPRKDKILLAPAGKLIMQGLINGLQSERGNLEDMLGGLNTSIPTSLNQEILASVNGGKGSSETPIKINVEWHAAPNDTIDTKKQVMDMLGKASELVREEVYA